MTILVCEDNLKVAIETFFREAHIPRPPDWNVEKDKTFLRLRIVPAFIEALKQIGDVQFCYGFDQSKVFDFGEYHWVSEKDR